jgi:UDP-2,3-diacylglucosamine hydrolase
MTRFPEPERVTGGVAVFADSHLGQADGDGEDFLAALGDCASRGLGTIVLLGDVFHYFIGDSKFETPLVRQVVAGWADLARRGVSLRYVEGNRDFFLEGTRWTSSFSRYGLVDGLDVGGRRFAFVHGDRVNAEDLPYRFWRLLSKNPVSWGVMKILPGALARRIVSTTEARLYDTNFRHKRRLPTRHLLAEAAAARRAGYDELLVGHFHWEWRAEATSDTSDPAGAAAAAGAPGTVHVLPAWLEERKHAEIASDGTLTVVEEPTAERARRREKSTGA